MNLRVDSSTPAHAVDVTQLLHAWQQGDDDAANGFMPELYDTLRQMAATRLRRERGSAAMAATELVNEAMLRLFAAQAPGGAAADTAADPGHRKHYVDRAHFLAVSALYMRSILVDRARTAVARDEPTRMLTLTLAAAQQPASDVDALQLVALDQALRELKAEDLRAARVMELSAFAGMQREEIAHVLSLSVPTVDRDLRFARAWINQALAA